MKKVGPVGLDTPIMRFKVQKGGTYEHSSTFNAHSTRIEAGLIKQVLKLPIAYLQK